MIRANKKLGQNFIKDESVLRTIIESVSEIMKILNDDGLDPDIIEIGPGLGDLSLKILDCFGLIAYEIDKRLCSHLKKRFQTNKFKLYNEDVLSIEFSINDKGQNTWLHNKPYLMVSNLPYYIATRVIINALKDTMCKGMVVMTQKEVAHKFCASSNSGSYCSISVIAESLSKEINFMLVVPPSCFEPIPKVDSAVFSIIKNGNTLDNDFENMLRQAFSSPRKKLSKNLSHINDISEILRKLGIHENARPHQITTSQYHQIFDTLRKNNDRQR